MDTACRGNDDGLNRTHPSLSNEADIISPYVTDIFILTDVPKGELECVADALVSMRTRVDVPIDGNEYLRPVTATAGLNSSAHFT